MNEVEQEIAQDSTEDNSIDVVNINLIHFNKYCSVLTANLKMSVGPNNFTVPHKIYTGSDVNIMPLYIYKKLFLNIMSEQLVATEKNNIQLKCITKL